MYIDAKTVIGECLKTSFGLDRYLDIIRKVNESNFKADDEFRKQYNSFFRVRQRSAEWYNCYFQLLEEQKRNKLDFQSILELLENKFNKVEVSFSSKLLATVDPNCPIWDQYVLKNLNLYDEWNQSKKKNNEHRIQDAVRIYEQIKTEYKIFLKSNEGKACIAEFDKILPDYKEKISNIKKIDFMLYLKRT